VSARAVRIVLAVVLGIAGIALGVYGDWILWHPMDGVMLTLGAGVLLVVAGVIALIPRRAARTAALGVLAFALGLVGGQVLSPGRPGLLGADGTILVALDRPTGATGSHVATCQTTEAGGELQVSGDPNLRLDVLGPLPGAPADVDPRAFVQVSLTVGDRWPDGTVSRTDDVDLSVSISSPAADKGETRLAASDASDIEIDWTPAGGTLRFAGLVDDLTGAPAPADLDLAGTISWTCGALEE
jgi:hypothetical protein